MGKHITLGGKRIAYELRQSKKARRLRLAVHRGGSVVLTLPRGFSVSGGERFLVEKRAWLLSKIAFWERFGGRAAQEKPEDYIRHKGAAMALAQKRIAHFNAMYGLRFKRITVRDQRTRWGSCSKKGNLNFNYRIALLPEKLADYIIVHELCHLAELNHSKKFWELVGRAIPDFRARRLALREAGFAWPASAAEPPPLFSGFRL